MLSSEAISLARNDQNCYFKYMLAWFEAVCWRGLKCGVYIIGMVTSHRSMVTLGGRPTLSQGVVHSPTTSHLYNWQNYGKPQWYHLFRSQSRYLATIVIVITQGQVKAKFAIFRSDGNTARECWGEWCQPCFRFLFPHLHFDVADGPFLARQVPSNYTRLKEDLPEKKNIFSFGHCSDLGGGPP